MVNNVQQDKKTYIEEAISNIMFSLGIEQTESNKDTPKRIAKMYTDELFSSLSTPITELEKQMTVFKKESSLYNTEMNNIVVENIHFSSTCEHHWLPFTGNITIEYLPNDCILGLSKFPRVVEFFSKKPQLQERLVNEIGDFLVGQLKPKYLKVTATAEHSCVACRGVKSVGVHTTTVFEFKTKTLIGVLKND